MRWTSTDGLEIEGLLTLPQGEGPFPLVLDVHGGPIGSSDDRFPGVLDALLLSRGFAILEPNPRGSTGHGRASPAGSSATWAGSTSTTCSPASTPRWPPASLTPTVSS